MGIFSANGVHSFSSDVVSLFKEQVLTSLTAQQKKILFIVSVAFSCLIACYTIYRCFKAKVATDEENQKEQDHRIKVVATPPLNAPISKVSPGKKPVLVDNPKVDNPKVDNLKVDNPKLERPKVPNRKVEPNVPSVPVSPAEHALNTIKKGNALVKTLKDFRFITKCLVNPADPETRKRLPEAQNLDKTKKLNHEGNWIPTPDRIKAAPTDTKSTSTTLLNTDGLGRLFTGEKTGNITHHIGLMFDAEKCRSSAIGYCTEDIYSRWSPWRDRLPGFPVPERVMDGRNIFLKPGVRLPGLQAMKDYLAEKRSAGIAVPYNEAYTHVSSDALLAVVFRSQVAFEDISTRVWAAVERMKLEQALSLPKHSLPILAVNIADGQPYEYTLEKQQEDIEQYLRDPDTQQNLSNHRSNFGDFDEVFDGLNEYYGIKVDKTAYVFDY